MPAFCNIFHITICKQIKSKYKTAQRIFDMVVGNVQGVSQEWGGWLYNNICNWSYFGNTNINRYRSCMRNFFMNFRQLKITLKGNSKTSGHCLKISATFRMTCLTNLFKLALGNNCDSNLNCQIRVKVQSIIT